MSRSVSYPPGDGGRFTPRTVWAMALVKQLAAAVAVGFGLLFASKAKDQHWSESPSVLVDEARAEGESADD